MLTYVSDTDMVILSMLNLNDMRSMCLTNKYFNKLYQNEILWRLRIIYEFGKNYIKKKSSHKKRYFDLLYPQPRKARCIRIRNDNITSDNKMDILRNYVKINKMIRGDVITVDRNGIDKDFLYDGQNIISLYYSWGADTMPIEFKCPTEFPIRYWSKFSKIRAVYFDTSTLGELSRKKVITVTNLVDISLAYPFNCLDPYSQLVHTYYLVYPLYDNNIEQGMDRMMTKLQIDEAFHISLHSYYIINESSDCSSSAIETISGDQILIMQFDDSSCLTDDDPWDF